MTCPDESSVRPNVGVVRKERHSSDGLTTRVRSPESDVLRLIWSSICCTLFVRQTDPLCGFPIEQTVDHRVMVDSKMSVE